MSGTALITGATGLLGSQVVQAFTARGWKTIGTGLTRASPPSTIKLDLLDGAAIEKALDEIKYASPSPHLRRGHLLTPELPDQTSLSIVRPRPTSKRVLTRLPSPSLLDTRPSLTLSSGAADRSPDSCSNNPTGARALNVTAAGTLTAAAARRAIFLLYISTDYVFPGTPGDAPYAPSAPTNPPNTYGLTKWEGENAVLEASTSTQHPEQPQHRPLAAVLRVPILYGKASKPSDSAVNVLVEQMDDYALRYPTNTADVGRVCVDVCALYTGRREPAPGAPSRLPTILHFSSEDCKTKLEMCKVLAGILGVGIEGLEPFRPAEEELKAEERGERVRRPYDCHLDTKETRALGIDCGCVDFEEWWRKELGAQ
ncbi:NAD-dependent epimerase/dehydratase [Macrophomina phaseolina MS6]|uniref:NAD-dependent epimerase/dehydratase n=1 Tax=Macrophomina phaseolina (strain MS6) TaxID=1126212 RepID=K2R903_MACPH|nr:NAD-dependent epimerase/dehydratase [Macrophomina phaseolina MS6]